MEQFFDFISEQEEQVCRCAECPAASREGLNTVCGSGCAVHNRYYGDGYCAGYDAGIEEGYCRGTTVAFDSVVAPCVVEGANVALRLILKMESLK